MEGADDDMDLLTGFSVFTGGGGLDIAAEAAGIKTVGRCEWDRYAQAVLMSRIRSRQLHDSPLWHDIASLDGRPWRGLVDCMFGGFPCQDVSFAGKRRAKKTLVEGSRSGYWSHFARLIREMEPGGVLVENVPGLLTGGLGDVLRDLAALGYDARWQVLSAAAVGAPHLRDRVFVVALTGLPLAHADGVGRGERPGDLSGGERQPVRGGQEGAGDVPDATDGGRPVRGGTSGQGRHPLRENLQAEAGLVLPEAAPERGREGKDDERLLGEGRGLREGERHHAGHALGGPALADADGLGQQERVLEGGLREGEPRAEEAAPGRGALGDTERGRRGRKSRRRAGAEPADGHARVPGGDGDGRPAQPGLGGALDGMGAGLDDARRTGGEVVRGDGEERALLEARLHPWGEGWEEGVPRVAKKVPYRVDRLRITGNGVVWQCAYPFFQEIAEVIIGARE